MKFFAKVFGKAGSQFVEKTGTALDNLITSAEEKGKLKNEFTGLINDFAIDMQGEITERHRADMTSDSWLSKNIRPLTLIFILVVYSLFSILDGNVADFNINDSYVDLLGQWGMLIMSFYFGSRMVEKTFKLVKNQPTKGSMKVKGHRRE